MKDAHHALGLTIRAGKCFSVKLVPNLIRVRKIAQRSVLDLLAAIPNWRLCGNASIAHVAVGLNISMLIRAVSSSVSWNETLCRLISCCESRRASDRITN
jgi:hypothetical protein